MIPSTTQAAGEGRRPLTSNDPRSKDHLSSGPSSCHTTPNEKPRSSSAPRALSTATPSITARSRTAAINADLPIPAGPSTSSELPRPPHAANREIAIPDSRLVEPAGIGAATSCCKADQVVRPCLVESTKSLHMQAFVMDIGGRLCGGEKVSDRLGV